VAGISSEHDDAVSQQDSLLDVVSDDEDGLGWDGLVLPELEKFAAEVFGCEDVECGEGLVHEEDFRFDDESSREADALAHTAGEFLWVGGLEAIKADRVDDLHAAFAAFGCLHATGFEGCFDVFEDREPGEEGEALKHN